MGGNFSTYLGNDERTSSTHSANLTSTSDAQALQLVWRFDAEAAVQSQPVEQNGIVYFGGNTGDEYALSANNGTLLWKTFLGLANSDPMCHCVEGVISTATVVGRHLYVDGGYPYLYALNSSTGSVEWRVPIGNGTNAQGFYDWSSPLVYDRHAYVGIASDCDQPLVQAGVDEFSLSTHSLVKYFDTSRPAPNGSSIWGSPSLNPATRTVFVTTGNPYGEAATPYSESVIALDASTLAVKATWQVPPTQSAQDGDFGVTPTLFTPSGGYPMLTAADKNGLLYAFYQSNLTVAWAASLCSPDSGEHISTAWGGGHVYAVSGETAIAGVEYNSSVRAFNPLTGTVVWARGFSEPSYYGYASPLWVNGLLIVPDGHALLVLNAKNGATLYHYTPPGHFVAAASIAGGEIFVGSSDGQVYAFATPSGSGGLPSRSVDSVQLPGEGPEARVRTAVAGLGGSTGGIWPVRPGLGTAGGHLSTRTVLESRRVRNP